MKFTPMHAVSIRTAQQAFLASVMAESVKKKVLQFSIVLQSWLGVSASLYNCVGLWPMATQRTCDSRM